ncbi:methyltransferase domain-containing protein [Siccirubricoccus deserti]
MPDRAADAYVRTVFDGYAPRFEASLISLGYRVPGLMRQAVERLLPEVAGGAAKLGPVLDLGCGTGLVGAALSDLIGGPLVGVDLSRPMLEQAAAKGIYTTLHQAEASAALLGPMPPQALITAADVFCYFGRLELLLERCRSRLRQGGLLLFSLERAAPGRAGNSARAGASAMPPITSRAAWRRPGCKASNAGRRCCGRRPMAWSMVCWWSPVPPVTEADAGYRAGIAALAQGTPDAALPLLQAAERAGEGGGFAALNLGLALMQLGRLSQAEAALTRAAAALPDHPEPYFRLGTIAGCAARRAGRRRCSLPRWTVPRTMSPPSRHSPRWRKPPATWRKPPIWSPAPAPLTRKSRNSNSPPPGLPCCAARPRPPPPAPPRCWRSARRILPRRSSMPRRCWQGSTPPPPWRWWRRGRRRIPSPRAGPWPRPGCTPPPASRPQRSPNGRRRRCLRRSNRKSSPCLAWRWTRPDDGRRRSRCCAPPSPPARPTSTCATGWRPCCGAMAAAPQCWRCWTRRWWNSAHSRP